MALSDIDKSPLYIDSTNGRVSIGTSSAESLPLTVAGSQSAIALVDTDRVDNTYYSAVWGDQVANLHLVADYQGTFGSSFISMRVGGTVLANEKVRVTSAGNVGIGVSDPSQALDLVGTGNSGTGSVRAGGVGSGTQAAFIAQAQFGSASFGTYASYPAVLNSLNSPMVYFNTNASGRAVFAEGITFNGDTGAANALDDYEEGTWTVQERHGQATITTNRANYTKIGRFVYASASVNISSTNTNNLNLTLPFASSITTYYAGNGSAGYHNLNSTYADNLRPVVENGADNVMFYYGTGSLVPCNGASGTRIDFTVVYMT